ncbi:MAG: MBL fold metallo-hydrolase [Micromonosporaceae bacterium]|nr:MBL fold metallo-hydrolase [Micromonosporaceae bacterium]
MVTGVSLRAVPSVSWVRNVRLPMQPHAAGTINAYLVDTGDGPVLIDTGFHSTATILTDALAASGVARGTLRAILITHNHADHIGASRWLRAQEWLAPGGELVLHELTDQVGRGIFVDLDQRQRRQLVDNGIDLEQVLEWEADLTAMARLADWPRADRLVRDRDRVELGGVPFTFLHTPGHSPDHCAIHVSADSEPVVFLGDLTLGREMPRVGVRDWYRADPVQDLLDSWLRVRDLDARVALPGHGGPVHDLRALDAAIRAAYHAERREFLRRYQGRLVSAADVMDELVSAQPGATFGVRQFVFYGALAMLTHLHNLGLARRVPGRPVRYEVGAAVLA